MTPRTDNGGKGQNGTFESTKASISPCPASESSAKADEDLSAAHGDSKGGQGQDAFSSTGMSRTLEGAAPPTGNDNTDMERSCGGLAEGKANAGKAVVVRAASQDMSSKKDIGRLPRRKPDTVAADFSAHLHGVDKYPLELARLCRFAQFLAENNLLREAYEVSSGCGNVARARGGGGARDWLLRKLAVTRWPHEVADVILSLPVTMLFRRYTLNQGHIPRQDTRNFPTTDAKNSSENSWTHNNTRPGLRDKHRS